MVELYYDLEIILHLAIGFFEDFWARVSVDGKDLTMELDDRTIELNSMLVVALGLGEEVVNCERIHWSVFLCKFTTLKRYCEPSEVFNSNCYIVCPPIFLLTLLGSFITHEKSGKMMPSKREENESIRESDTRIVAIEFERMNTTLRIALVRVKGIVNT